MNAETKVVRDYSIAQTNAECRRNAALRDIRDRYARLLRLLCARQSMEETRVQRAFLQGRFGR